MPSGLAEWADYIGRVAPRPVMLGLDRAAAVWRQMGVSLEGRAVVTVGGTNGKGSCTAIMDAILERAGYRAMRYSSPHLLAYNERVRIAGEDAPDGLLCDSFAAVEEARRKAGNVDLTYFEFATLGAAWCAVQAECEILALEVGLGGRLDAVNLFDADVAVITMVGIDHVEHLGSDREQIGSEKAHIMRPGRAAIVGELKPPASLELHAQEIGARALVLGRDYGFRAEREGAWDYLGLRADCRSLPYPALRGDHQLANAAAALAALETLRERFPLAAGQIREGLHAVRLEGRMQVLPGEPCTILDVAHNPSAAAALARMLAKMGYFRSTAAIIGVMADKDAGGIVSELAGHVDRWIAAPLGVERGEDPGRLKRRIGEAGAQCVACDSMGDARRLARSPEGGHDRIVVLGSFLTVSRYLELERQ